MASKVENLWPPDVAASTKRLSPVAILRQQATLLGQRTKNIVEAEVETKGTDFQRRLQHWFYLVAPGLDFYKYPLFLVEHDPTKFYPLKIVWWNKIGSGTPSANKRTSLAERAKAKKELSADSEETFKAHLKRIFADDQTKGVIQSLIDQSVG